MVKLEVVSRFAIVNTLLAVLCCTFFDVEASTHPGHCTRYPGAGAGALGKGTFPESLLATEDEERLLGLTDVRMEFTSYLQL